eukprot:6213540-Pleurochrysis_carterae.AAC.2
MIASGLGSVDCDNAVSAPAGVPPADARSLWGLPPTRCVRLGMPPLFCASVASSTLAGDAVDGVTKAAAVLYKSRREVQRPMSLFCDSNKCKSPQLNISKFIKLPAAIRGCRSIGRSRA